jgi:hypothetical protein
MFVIVAATTLRTVFVVVVMPVLVLVFVLA